MTQNNKQTEVVVGTLEIVEVIGEGVFEHVFKACVPGLVTPVSACEEFVGVRHSRAM